ncbi:MAG: serine/threonine protein kinase [Deltaproteobacteria bacterium]|nr:serine/threonine protein kinase [Deltaproteobacteria bacterium]
MILESGAILAGRYEIVSFVGRGGIAEVYLARDRTLGAEIALKVLLPHLSDNPIVAERFRREVVAVRRVSHPNVIVLYDVGDADGLTYLTMEYVAGVDLKARIRADGALDVAALGRIGAQVLAGVSAAHREGVVHRDVKPQNILVGAEDRVKVVDFGLARVDTLLGLTAGSLLLGTPEYAAPELLTTSLVDARADVYSVGVTLFEAATGRLPFRDVTPYALIRRQAEDAPPSPRAIRPELPEAVERVILKALAKDPDDRFQSAVEMRDALLDAVDARKRGSETRADSVSQPGDDSAPSSRCVKCGADLLAGVRACFECGHEPFAVRPVDGPGHCIMLPRLGEHRSFFERDYLTFEQKHSLVEFLDELSAEPVDTREADRDLKRPPVMLVDRLAPGDAKKLAARLRERGVPCETRKKDALANIPYLFMTKNFTTMLTSIPTFLVPLFLFVNIFGTPVGALPGVAAGVVLVGYLLKLRLRIAKPLAAIAAKEASVASEEFVVKRTRIALKRIRAKPLRKSLKRLASRALSLLRRVKSGGAAWADVEPRVRRVFDGAIKAVEEIEDVEEKLAASDPIEMMEAMRDLSERFSRAAEIREADEIMGEKRDLLAALEERRESEEARARAYAQLLAAPRAFERAEAFVAQGIAGRATGGETLAEAMRELEIDVEATVAAKLEVDAAAPVPAIPA